MVEQMDKSLLSQCQDDLKRELNSLTLYHNAASIARSCARATQQTDI